jgi:uncharacterized protein YqgV (UPF0045/DUF77 family)
MKLAYKPAVITSLLTIATLVGCAQQQPTVEQSKTALCTALATYNQAVASLEALGPSSTVGQLREAQKAVKKAQEGVSAAAANYQQIKVDTVKSSVDELERQIGKVSDKMTINQALQSIKPQVVGVKSAVQQVNSQLQCP